MARPLPSRRQRMPERWSKSKTWRMVLPWRSGMADNGSEEAGVATGVSRLAHATGLPVVTLAASPERLKPADGALGAHANAVHEAYKDFLVVARQIADRAALKAP